MDVVTFCPGGFDEAADERFTVGAGKASSSSHEEKNVAITTISAGMHSLKNLLSAVSIFCGVGCTCQLDKRSVGVLNHCYRNPIFTLRMFSGCEKRDPAMWPNYNRKENPAEK